jgi:anti-sigma factor RsiW
MSTLQTDEMRCQEVVEVITSYLEGRMDAADVVRFEAHLTGCDACGAYLAQMRATIAALGHLPPESLSPRARKDILAAFEGWRQGLDDASPV